MGNLTITKLNTKKAADGMENLTGIKISVPFNPDALTHNRKAQVTQDNGSNTAGAQTATKGKSPDTLSFDLYFDGTGAIPGSGDVKSWVDSLYGVCIEYDTDDHQENVLMVQWNSFNMTCMCESFNTSYTLFKPDGTPLRAKVSLSFTEYTKPEIEENTTGNNSPDMTEAELIREGDSLPNMCLDKYDSIGQYINVARYNGLVNFRKLETGSNLILPPIDR